MYRNDILRSAGNKNKDKNKDIFILSYYCCNLLRKNRCDTCVSHTSCKRSQKNVSKCCLTVPAKSSEHGRQSSGYPQSTGDTAAPPAEEQPAEPEPTPEPTPVPTFDGLSVQPAVFYYEGEQPSYTVTPDNNLNMRAGPGTDYDKVSKVPASTVVTALGANEDGSWVVVNYDGKYGWLKAEFLS